jgi:PAS domain-containing protein
MAETILRSISRMHAGDRYCEIYRTDEDHRRTVVDFVREGLARGEKMMYLVNIHTASYVEKVLRAAGVDNVLRISSARRDRERLRLLEEAAEEVLWDWSPDTGEFRCGGGAHTLLGDVVVQNRLAWKFEQVHPDDTARVRQSFAAALDAVDVETWRDEYRQQRADGTFLRVEDHAPILRDSSGRPYGVVGALRDVTEIRALFAREEAAGADAERANATKDEFLAMLGHELRIRCRRSYRRCTCFGRTPVPAPPRSVWPSSSARPITSFDSWTTCSTSRASPKGR